MAKKIDWLNGNYHTRFAFGDRINREYSEIDAQSENLSLRDDCLKHLNPDPELLEAF